MRGVRAVVDTNIWISALINHSGYPARLIDALRLGLFVLVVSELLLQELTDVLNRPRIKVRYGIST